MLKCIGIRGFNWFVFIKYGGIVINEWCIYNVWVINYLVNIRSCLKYFIGFYVIYGFYVVMYCNCVFFVFLNYFFRSFCSVWCVKNIKWVVICNRYCSDCICCFRGWLLIDVLVILYFGDGLFMLKYNIVFNSMFGVVECFIK